MQQHEEQQHVGDRRGERDLAGEREAAPLLEQRLLVQEHARLEHKREQQQQDAALEHRAATHRLRSAHVRVAQARVRSEHREDIALHAGEREAERRTCAREQQPKEAERDALLSAPQLLLSRARQPPLLALRLTLGRAVAV